MDNPNAKEEIEAFERFGTEIPEGLKEPKLHDIEHSLWQSFWDLSTERQSGMTQGRIRWSSIQRYAATTGIELLVFGRVMQAMDNAYLTRQSGKSKKFTRDMMRR